MDTKDYSKAGTASAGIFSWDGDNTPLFRGYDLNHILGRGCGGHDNPGFEKDVADAIVTEVMAGHDDVDNYELGYEPAQDVYTETDPNLNGLTPVIVGIPYLITTADGGVRKLYEFSQAGWTWSRHPELSAMTRARS